MALPLHLARTLARTSRHSSLSSPYIPCISIPFASSTAPHRLSILRAFHSSGPTFANSAPNPTSSDYYSVLGIPRNASAQDVKKAYYKLAKTHHPDSSNSGNPETFAEINQAYEILSDDKRRKIYDDFGHQGLEASDAGVDPHAAGMGSMGGMGGFNSVSAEDLLREFGQIFTGQNVQRSRVDAPAPGDNKETVVTLEFMDAVRGIERTISVPAMRTCNPCKGTGKTEETRVESCTMCDGRGHVQMRGGMFQSFITTCSACSGSGKSLRNPCITCNGNGVTAGVKESKVAFPAGADSGMVLRVPYGGDDGIRGGSAGDLYIAVQVKQDDYFHRDGRDLHVVAPISIAQAALGGSVTVRTIDGEENIRIRPGTQPDDRVTMSGRALRGIRGNRKGDQVVHLKVVVPDQLSERQRELLTELAELEGGKINRPDECGSKGLLERFQRFLRNSIGGRR